MFSLWRKARRENSAASRLLGSTSLRFALHGWQRRTRRQHCRVKRLSTADLPGTRAQFETSGKHAEQERPMKNH
ncbi:hypothetical protein, partial [Thiolapillus sp.]|uniref:hypothetical protein n=1 Tax=Thiolapillus sp. TaxID=2017437 RepID=UPI003AF4B052